MQMVDKQRLRKASAELHESQMALQLARKILAEMTNEHLIKHDDWSRFVHLQICAQNDITACVSVINSILGKEAKADVSR